MVSRSKKHHTALATPILRGNEQTEEPTMPYFIYILECINGSYYTGYTTDLTRRYQEHLQGSVKCKYTRSFPPKKVAAYWEVHADLAQVLKLEYQIKQLSKAAKQQLIRNPKLLKSDLYSNEQPSLISLTMTAGKLPKNQFL